MGFFGRISNGWTLTMKSLAIVRENKHFLVFTLLSGISLLLVMGSFVGSLAAQSDAFDKMEPAVKYGIYFMFYFTAWSVVIFFNMALIHCALKTLNGEETSVADGIVFSFSRMHLVLSWAFISATIGLLLRVLEDKSEKLTAVITAVLGVAWSLMTFMVVPVLAYENVSVFQAIKRSSALLRNSWGERIGAGFSFGLVGFLLFLALAFSAGGIFLLLLKLNIVPGLFAFFVCLVVIALTVMCLMSTAETVFTALMYQYSIGKATGNISHEEIKGSFARI
jgi:hypothetical protein